MSKIKDLDLEGKCLTIRSGKGMRAVVMSMQADQSQGRVCPREREAEGLVANGGLKQNRELLDGRWDKNATKECANAADLISQESAQIAAIKFEQFFSDGDRP